MRNGGSSATFRFVRLPFCIKHAPGMKGVDEKAKSSMGIGEMFIFMGALVSKPMFANVCLYAVAVAMSGSGMVLQLPTVRVITGR